MPELPEVETLSFDLRGFLIGKTLESHISFTNKLRIDLPSRGDFQNLYGHKVEKIFRIGKTLFFEFKNDLFLTFHFGMTGYMELDKAICNSNSNSRHKCLALNFSDGIKLGYFSQRKFGSIQIVNKLPDIPPDPLEKEFNDSYLRHILMNHKSSIKQVLMNQKLISGIGNICANEALFASGIRPDAASDKIGLKKISKLVSALKSVLLNSIRAGKDSFDKILKIDKNTMKFQFSQFVYGLENITCKKCSQARIIKLTICGRSSFYCQVCQK